MTKKESRLFPILTIAVLITILTILPGRYRLLPQGLDAAIGFVLALAVAAAGMTAPNSLWTRVERYAIIAVACIATTLEVGVLVRLLYDMAHPGKGVDAITLLSTAVGIWITNIAIFALVYWQIDRGGPSSRATGWEGRADFSFPRGDDADGVPADWMPSFPDYLFLAFNSASAFSPTDAVPLTARAKMLMMSQSIISLVTVVAVAARAINILGS